MLSLQTEHCKRLICNNISSLIEMIYFVFFIDKLVITITVINYFVLVKTTIYFDKWHTNYVYMTFML